MYVIKYDRDIYAGTYNDMDGTLSLSKQLG